MSENKMLSATNDLINSADFQQLERAFSTFCPFEAMGMVRAEIRHSNFLAYLFNPFRPHGLGTAVLDAFTRDILAPASSTDSVLNLQNAEVRREWSNIDLLVVLPSARRILAVELKIDATQSFDQLRRYRKIVEATWPKREGWKHSFVFLTKNDEEPNDDAWISYRLQELVDQLDVVAKSPTLQGAQGLDALRAYIRMLRRHHLGDVRLEELAQKLWAKHGDALSFLMDRKPDPLKAVLDSFRENASDFVAMATTHNIALETDEHSERIIRFGFSSWDGLPGFRTAKWTETQRLVLLEVKREGSRISGCLYLGPGLTGDRDRYADALFPKKLARSRGAAIPEWVCLANELLVDSSSAEADVQDALAQCMTRMCDFTVRMFKHFDPIMRTIVR